MKEGAWGHPKCVYVGLFRFTHQLDPGPLALEDVLLLCGLLQRSLLRSPGGAAPSSELAY